MEKSFATDDHTDLLKAAGGKAFHFFERNERMTKSASDVVSRADLQEHMPPDSHFGVHLITMGMEEAFGPNRNGDSASKNSLESHHGTFEKFGCVFREHKNRNAVTQGVGAVRLAKVNPGMHRGELVCWVDKDKAPDMYKKAKAGEELSWSMSMRLPHDECSICRNKSRRTTDYCSHLRDNMLQYVGGHEKYAYARNEDNVKFFDISEVKRRADRIATYLNYMFTEGDDMAKAAAADQIITGAEWATHQFGDTRIVAFDPWEDTTLEKLAEAEIFVREAQPETQAVLARIAPQNLTHAQIETLAVQDFRSAGGELAKTACIVNFPTFASIITGRKIDDLEKDADFVGAADAKLPSLFSDMLAQGGCDCGENIAESVAPDETGCSFSPDKDNIDRLIREVGDELGMSQEKSKDRGMKIMIIKKASLRTAAKKDDVDPFFAGMVSAYGHYVVKAAHQIKDLPDISTHTFYRGLAASNAFQAS